ncbi:MAG: small subunit ribosomal protein S19e [Thermoplasmata archaeon]|jgi:small subunit ribosomal protein S19e|nr:small subunit ribosomal protein S19e [Thermoplasmata archaeon]
MTTVYDVPAEPLIRSVAGKLKGEKGVAPPAWAPFVTTGIHAEKPPVEADWWHVRAAAVLRKVYVMGPVGTERLRSEFGGARDRGSKPNRAKKGSGSVIRECLQQLEKSGLVENVKGEGRRVSAKGRSLLDNAAHEVRQTIQPQIAGLAKY